MEKNYFYLYEERYRGLREQGVDDWVYKPQELSRTFKAVDEFLEHSLTEPSKTSIIELGCGQGHLAEYLINKDYKYLGVDISVLAITRARQKLGIKGNNSFMLGDVTSLKQIPDVSYDITIDNQCFHMLITDEHRCKYLSEIKRILKKDGKGFFQEIYQPDEFTEKIFDIEQFNRKFSGEQKAPQKYSAFVNGKERNVELPGLPARANNEAGYRKELSAAGFNLDYFKIIPGLCIMYAGKKG